MKVALHNSYVEYVCFMGITEKYPKWFQKEIYNNVLVDEDRYTFYVPEDLRSPDYHEKVLIEDYSVFIRKPNGEIFVTNFDIFNELYITFEYNAFTNSGLAAFEPDTIEYVECHPGILSAGYPDWFYDYFTEAVNFPEETIFMHDNGGVSVDHHCVFLCNKYGEIKHMEYRKFLKYYNPEPRLFK